MRLQKDNLSEEEKLEISEFAQWLLHIGNGSIDRSLGKNQDWATWIKIPEDLLLKCAESPIESIVSSIYDNFHSNYQDHVYLRQRAIVTPYNEIVDSINSYVLDSLPGILKTYFSTDYISKGPDQMADQELLYPIEFLNSLRFPGIPDHELKLKLGSIVMLLKMLIRILDYAMVAEF